MSIIKLKGGYTIENFRDAYLVLSKDGDYDNGICTTGELKREFNLARHLNKVGNYYLSSAILYKSYLEILFRINDEKIFTELLDLDNEYLFSFFEKEAGLRVNYSSLFDENLSRCDYNVQDTVYKVVLSGDFFVLIDKKGKFISLVNENNYYTMNLLDEKVILNTELDFIDIRMIIQSLIYFLFYKINARFIVTTAYKYGHANVLSEIEYKWSQLDKISENIFKNIKYSGNDSRYMDIFDIGVESNVNEFTKPCTIDFFSKDNSIISSVDMELTKSQLDKFIKLSKETYVNGIYLLKIRE